MQTHDETSSLQQPEAVLADGPPPVTVPIPTGDSGGNGHSEIHSDQLGPPPPVVRARSVRYSDGPDRIRPLVSQIRDRMQEINEREFALRRREYELEQTQRALVQRARTTAESELAALRESLEARTADLERSAQHLAARLADAGAREQTLDRREVDLLAAQRELERLRGELRAARQSVDEEAERLQQQRAAEREEVARKLEALRGSERELQARSQDKEALLERERLGLQRAETELEARAAALQRDITAQADRRAQLDKSETDLNECLAALEHDQLDLARQRSELEAERTALAETQRVAEREHGLLAERQQQLDRDAVELELRRQSLQRQADENTRRATELAETRAQLDQRRADLEQSIVEFERRVAGYADRERAMQAAEGEIAHRRRLIEEHEQRLRQVEGELDRHRDELYELGKAVESREASARQAAAALEIERHQTLELRNRLEQAASEIDRKRFEVEQRFAETHSLLASEARELQRAAGSVVSAPTSWLRRSVALGALAAAVVGPLYWLFDRPTTRTTARLSICGDSKPFHISAGEQIAAFQEADAIGPAFADLSQLQAWQNWIDAGRLTITTNPGAQAIELALDAVNPAEARRVLDAACRARIAAHEEAGVLTELPFAYRLLDARAANLRDEERQATQRSGSLRERLAATPEVDTAAAVTGLDELRAEQTRTVDELTRARARFSALTAETYPRGLVPAGAVEKELAGDEMFQQDSSELSTVAIQYRAELLGAVAGPIEPTAALGTALRSFRRVLGEQLALSPPESVARVLEDGVDLVETTTQRVEEFASSWRKLGPMLERIELPQAAVELLAQYDAAADSARKALRDSEESLGSVKKRLDELQSLGGGSTREVVVLAVVRGDFTSLIAALANFAEAIRNTDVATNFQLDALDRQMRSLQKRLAERPEAIRERLQIAADQMAQEQHAQEIAATREHVHTLEEQREAGAAKLIATMEQMQRDQTAALERARIVAELEEIESGHQRRVQELSRLEADLHAARTAAAGVKPDVLALAGPIEASVSNPGPRIMSAGLAALGAFGLTWLLCFMMVVRNPIRTSRNAGLVNELAAHLPDEEPHPAATG